VWLVVVLILINDGSYSNQLFLFYQDVSIHTHLMSLSKHSHFARTLGNLIYTRGGHAVHISVGPLVQHTRS